MSLNADSTAMIPSILNAIRERHSTDITVTGHTDTTADAQFNYQLGLRRAERVVEILKGQGVNPSDIFSSSHGDSDLLVKTALRRRRSAKPTGRSDRPLGIDQMRSLCARQDRSQF